MPEQIPKDVINHILSFFGRCELCQGMIPYTTFEMQKYGMKCTFCKCSWCDSCIKKNDHINLQKRYFESWFYVCETCRHYPF